MMEKRTTYCSHCKKDVSLVMTLQPIQHGGHANVPDGHELVCLDFGRACEGGRCPLSGLPTVVMGVRLARSELTGSEPWETVHGVCESCGFPSELAMVGEASARCTLCGSVNRVVLLKLDDGTRVAATGATP
jgi:DNA-directed RNA polymerase subunit RPC12/RpoP